MKNIILIDFLPPSKWFFQMGLEKSTQLQWEIVSYESNKNHGSKFQNMIRYMKYFLLPFRIYYHRKELERVIAWQQFYGLILAFYLRLFQSKASPSIIVMTFIYNQKHGFFGKIYHAFVRYAVSSRYIKRIVVFSEQEKIHYAKIFEIPESKFVYTKLSVEDVKESCLDILNHGNTVVSAGRSNRDYEFLQKAWKKQKRELRIICDSLADRSEENISILNNCHGDAYLQELATCHAVIVPLKNENISSGQLVILHAMMLGKPVIVTKNAAITEYVVNNTTGFIIEKTVEALEAAIEKMEDPREYQKMSDASRKYYEQNFSMELFGMTVGRIATES